MPVATQDTSATRQTRRRLTSEQSNDSDNMIIISQTNSAGRHKDKHTLCTNATRGRQLTCAGGSSRTNQRTATNSRSERHVTRLDDTRFVVGLPVGSVPAGVLDAAEAPSTPAAAVAAVAAAAAVVATDGVAQAPPSSADMPLLAPAGAIRVPKPPPKTRRPPVFRDARRFEPEGRAGSTDRAAPTLPSAATLKRSCTRPASC
jgi:hypothetical protein